MIPVQRFRIIRTILTLLIITLPFGLVPPSISSSAAPASPQSANDVWKLYTNPNFVNDVAVEASAVWVGTSGGLLRWDKATGAYQFYHPTNSGLGNMAVSAIAIDGLNNKWFGTGNGLYKFDGVNWTSYTTGNGLVSNNVYDLAFDGSGNLWITASGGISMFNGASFTNYTTSNSGLTTNSVTAVAIHGNVKWFGTWNKGIFSFDDVTWNNYILGSGSSVENHIHDIAVAPNGVKWFAAGNSLGSSGGGGGSLTSFDGSTWTSYTSLNSGLVSSYVFSVEVDGSGVVWAGTEFGVSRWDGATWTSYTTAAGLTENWVYAVTVEGTNLWFGTNGGGVSRFSAGAWTTFKTPTTIQHNSLFSLAAVGNQVWHSGGSWFVINRYSGITRYDGFTWKFYSYYDTNLSTPEVHSIVADTGGKLWLGGWGVHTFDGVNWNSLDDPYGYGQVPQAAIDGNVKWFYSYEPFGSKQWVSSLEGSTWTAYTPDNSGLVDTPVYGIAVDTNHAKWFATYSGVSKFDGATWTTYTTTHGLASNKVYAVLAAPDGSKWFGTDAGASKFDGSTWTTYHTGNSGLANNRVNSIAVDSSGRLWFATHGGVSLFDGATWTTYTTSNSGLASNTVYKVTITDSGHRWFYTSAGVSEFYTVPQLEINYTSGAPGSYFNLTGVDFPPNLDAEITVNGAVLGTVPIDASGAFTFTLTTSSADEGIYFATASVNPFDIVRFTLESAGEVHAQEGSHPVYDVPAGIAYLMELFLPMIRR